MDIAILGFDRSLADIAANIGRTSREGFTGFWVPNGRGSDALTALAIAGTHVNIRLGTAVIPVHPRHPVALAQQALTVNAILDGRLALGLGVSHRPIVEDGWGLSFDRPLSYMEEYLTVLIPLLEDHSAQIDGERVSMHGELDIESPPCPVFLAALGPKMLELAGRRANGTITWMVGLETLRTLTAPTINAAAAEAGREAPEVVVGLPVCVTDDQTAAQANAHEMLRRYGELPSYRAMLDREGLSDPGQLAVIGSEDEVEATLRRFVEAGATSIAASPMGTRDEQNRTRKFLASLVG
jgi:5,10-methylenetetrahydromethanopterin reductase